MRGTSIHGYAALTTLTGVTCVVFGCKTVEAIQQDLGIKPVEPATTQARTEPTWAPDRQRAVETPADDGYTTVRLSRFDQDASVRVAQRDDYWCWAACAEMIYRYEGRTDLQQEEIVERVKQFARLLPAGSANERNGAAVQHEMTLALAADYNPADEWGRQVDTQEFSTRLARGDVKLDVISSEEFFSKVRDTSGLRLNTNFVVDSLRAGHPVVAALHPSDDGGYEIGHAYVVYGIDYKEVGQELDHAVRQLPELPPDAQRRSPLGTGRVSIPDLPGRTQNNALGSGVSDEFVPRYIVRTVHLIDPAGGKPVTMSLADFQPYFVMNRPKARDVVERVTRLPID